MDDGVSNPVMTIVSETDVTPAEAVDYWALAWRGEHRSEWAEKRGVNTQTVSDNLESALEKIRQDPDGVYVAIADCLREFVDGQLVDDKDSTPAGAVTFIPAEIPYDVETPDDLESFERELNDRCSDGEITFLVTAPIDDVGEIKDDVQIQIVEVC
jgi:hypothetical protein